MSDEVVVKRGRGRPKGSKNKVKKDAKVAEEVVEVKKNDLEVTEEAEEEEGKED